ncbi:MFS transporter [Candidatus Bathyarchaeota archaeon]|nr:MFS transporter [Candidatus Bathyarchaeota archaeon]
MSKVRKVGFRWVALGLSWVTWLLQGITIFSIGAMIPSLIQEFNLVGWQAGALMTMSWVPGIVLSIPVGILIGRYGGRRLGGVGLLLLGLGLCTFSVANNFWILALARLLAGIGVVLCISPPQAWTTSWFPPEELGTALGFLISGYSGSGIIGIFAMGYILTSLGWRTTALMFGILSFIWMILMFAARREAPPIENPSPKPSENKKNPLDPPSVAEAFKNIELWKVGIAWFAIVGIFTGYATWAPTTMIANLKMAEAEAAALAGVASITAVPFHIAGGWISDRLKPKFGRKIMIWLPTLICALAYYLIGVSGALILTTLAIILIGIFNWVSNAATFAAGAEAVDPSLVGFAFGFLAFTSSVGSVIVPIVMGYLYDATGTFAMSWTFPAILALLGGIVALTIRKK